MKDIKEYIKGAPRIMKVLMLISTLFSVLMFIASFILPPLGVIDQSVLLASSELDTSIAIFCGIITIAQGRALKIKKGDLEIETRKHHEGETSHECS